MIAANELLGASVSRRRSMILEEAGELPEGELEKAKALSDVLNSFLPAYFELKIAADGEREEGSALDEGNIGEAFSSEVDDYSEIAKANLRSSVPTAESLKASSKNIYEMAGAEKLAFSNNVTRTLNTTMGLLWERLASVSPYAVNPELEFGQKIKGIDLIARNKETGDIEYQQLKTQKNTLTGSQKPRSVQELKLHASPVFCACLANNSSWTFNHPDIPRVAGEEFWSRLGIDYVTVLEHVEELVRELEELYVELICDD